jgi:hypothetical protein
MAVVAMEEDVAEAKTLRDRAESTSTVPHDGSMMCRLADHRCHSCATNPTPPPLSRDIHKYNSTKRFHSFSLPVGLCAGIAVDRIAAGCTACVALKAGDELYVANAGETRPLQPPLIYSQL